MRTLFVTFFIALSLTPASAQVEFSISQTLDLSSTTPLLYGDYLQLVDVTGDGIRDLITTNSANLQAYQHQGAAGFVEIASTPLPGSGTLAAVADLNNDGAIDALVRLNNGYVSMLGNGAGGFTPAASYTTASDLGQVLIGDFNGDGIRDAVAARGTGGTFGGALISEIDIRLGNGDGTFGAAIRSELAGGLNSPVVVDLDENGTDDLVLAGLFQLTFVFVNNGAAYNSVTYPAGVGDAPQDIRVEDLNADGHLDVIFTCPLLNRVGVLIQNGLGFIGSFEDYAVTGTPVTVRASDVNGDGIPDLLTTTDIGLEWRLGLGDGTFGSLDNMPMTTAQARFAVGDSTNDGLAEVAILSDSSVLILLNTTSSTPTLAQFIRGDTNLDGQVQITDAMRTLAALFISGSPPLECQDSADSDDDGVINLFDAVYLLNYLFIAGSPTPPAPGVNDCGADPTADSLADCAVVASCP